VGWGRIDFGERAGQSAAAAWRCLITCACLLLPHADLYLLFRYSFICLRTRTLFLYPSFPLCSFHSSLSHFLLSVLRSPFLLPHIILYYFLLLFSLPLTTQLRLSNFFVLRSSLLHFLPSSLLPLLACLCLSVCLSFSRFAVCTVFLFILFSLFSSLLSYYHIHSLAVRFTALFHDNISTVQYTHSHPNTTNSTNSMPTVPQTAPAYNRPAKDANMCPLSTQQHTNSPTNSTCLQQQACQRCEHVPPVNTTEYQHSHKHNIPATT
jgi:hypothetical protein